MKITLTEAKKAVKNVDGFFASYVSSTLSPYLVKASAALNIHPNTLTFFSVVTTLVGIFLFFLGSQAQLIIGAILIQIGLIFDVADGQLARATNQKSAFGAWFDYMSDRLTEFLAIFALTYSAFQASGDTQLFTLAFAGILATNLRHYDFSLRKNLGIIDLSNKYTDEKKIPKTGFTRLSAILKESLLFMQSERLAVISICAILGKIELMLWIYCIWGALILLAKSGMSWYNHFTKSSNKTSL
ncbi:MAG: hypothetical protein A3F54_05245 [Candidatus Kerfeldbacteria bacterium RIFCSPHIGHO2_12_FULL_48_17]|uniref:CDP-alcohol phosphatidyltransferase n=1 Tax=Candidatus Kerfeldbacteria bacterium RIFCSPHIGHO2_12_FULL_48_17 TaxID=1798542 RepID=A0A1G2B694_9BACT|nr:MAG: hypothetical protein A3F54_05245 [Candidatus Kerfeldbacteria bacterium RIFCSPHIGHO2_12_FULL_48_17]